MVTRTTSKGSHIATLRTLVLLLTFAGLVFVKWHYINGKRLQDASLQFRVTSGPNQDTTSWIDNRIQFNSSAYLQQNKHYLCALDNYGRLGNQMFRYAVAYGVAKAKNLTLFVNSSDMVVQLFNIEADIVENGDRICNSFQTVWQPLCCTYQPNRILAFSSENNTALYGYIFSYKYFHDVREDIRRQFQCKPYLQHHVKQYLNTIRERYYSILGGNITLIGLHVRMDDKLGSTAFKRGYRVPGKQYLYNAIDYYRFKFRNSVFVIGGQNPDWVKQVIPRSHHLEFLPAMASPEHDMLTLSSCDHMILTIGTFSWWCGYLSSGLVVYYKDFLAPGSALWLQYNYSDYFPPDWIPLS